MRVILEFCSKYCSEAESYATKPEEYDEFHLLLEEHSILIGIEVQQDVLL